MQVSERTQNAGPKLDRPVMKQPMFDWSSTDKYAELRNFKIEVKNMFQTSSISQAERVAITKNWLGRQGLKLLETPTQAEQEKCITVSLFETLSNKFKPQYNENIKFLQFHKIGNIMKMQKNGWADLD